MKQVSTGNGFACGLTDANMPVCWGENNEGQSTPPASARFTDVAAGFDDACGITAATESVVCWGNPDNPATKPHQGRYMSIELMPYFTRGPTTDYACGMHPSGNIDCWGFPDGILPAPEGAFASWSLGLGTICGVRQDHSVSCRGDVDFTIPAPDHLPWLAGQMLQGYSGVPALG
jgi:hypothetical protein